MQEGQNFHQDRVQEDGISIRTECKEDGIFIRTECKEDESNIRTECKEDGIFSRMLKEVTKGEVKSSHEGDKG